MEYNENIRALRRAKGWTQQQLADEADVSRQMVTRWENGWNVPSLPYAAKLAGLFGVSVTELMTGNAPPARDAAPAAKKHDLLGCAVFLCALSFLPVALFYLFETLTEAARQFLLLEGFNSALDYRTVTDLLEAAGGAACALLYAAIFLYWAAKFITASRAEEDKYLRSRMYRQWTAGLLFLIANGFVLFMSVCVPELSFPLPLEYVGAALIAAFAVLFFDLLFKRLARGFMVIARDTQREKLDLGFLIAAGIVLAAGIALLTYVAAAGGSGAPMAAWLILFGFFIAAGIVLLVYIALRLALRGKRERENRD